MADVDAIRDALKTAIQTATFFVHDTMPSIPIVPCAVVSQVPGTFLAEVTFDGCEDLDFVVMVLVQQVVDGASQDNADAYLSEGTRISDRINSGSTSNWDYAVALPVRNYGQFVFGQPDTGVKYLGFEIPVRVGVS